MSATDPTISAPSGNSTGRPLPAGWTLAGRNFLVTGGTKGIGLAIARSLLEHGASRLVICSRNADECLEVQTRLMGDFPDASIYGVPCDVSTAEGRARLVREVEAHCLNELDGLCNITYDVNNDPSAHEAESFARHNLRWVKAFNDVGAVDIISRKSKSKLATRMSAVDSAALSAAKDFAEIAMGFEVQASYHNDRKTSEQNSIGKEWKHAAYVALFFYTAFLLIVVATYYIVWPYPIPGYQFSVKSHNKVMSSTAMSLFAFSLLPGTFARIVKAWNRGNSMYRFHPVILWGLGIRKHTGLIGMFSLLNHVVMSLVEFSPANYYWCMFASKESTSMDQTGEVSMVRIALHDWPKVLLLFISLVFPPLFCSRVFLAMMPFFLSAAAVRHYFPLYIHDCGDSKPPKVSECAKAQFVLLTNISLASQKTVQVCCGVIRTAHPPHHDLFFAFLSASVRR